MMERDHTKALELGLCKLKAKYSVALTTLKKRDDIVNQMNKADTYEAGYNICCRYTAIIKNTLTQLNNME